MELREYWELFRKWLWLILLTTIIAALAAYVFSIRQTPIYQASTRLLVSQSASGSSSVQYSDLLAAERLSSTYAQMLSARPLLEKAIEKADLQGVVFVKELEKAVSVQPVRNTRLIDLRVEYSDPTIAARLANTLPEVFVEFINQQQTERYRELKDSLQQQLEELSNQIQETDKQLQALGENNDPDLAARKTELEDRIVQYRTTYGNVLAQLESIRLTEVNLMDTLTVVEPAEVPELPIRPRVLMNTLLAAIVGGMLGLGIAFLYEYLDDTIQTPDDIARIANVSILGVITRTKNSDQKQIIAVEDPRSPITEAYRSVRTAIQFAGVDRPMRTLVVTSASAGEGKSTTAANLAVVMAQTGKKVILIDADLRKPIQHIRWGVPNTVGLTGALLMDEISENLEYLLTETPVENLWLLTSGQLPHNPSELLGSQKLQQLTEYLLQEYDILIFDSPPALAVTDPVVLGRVTDGVIVVVDAGKTREPALLHVLLEMERIHAHLVGIVLNRYKQSHSSAYYYYDERYYRHDMDEKGENSKRSKKRSRNTYKGWLSRQFSRFFQ